MNNVCKHVRRSWKRKDTCERFTKFDYHKRFVLHTYIHHHIYIYHHIYIIISETTRSTAKISPDSESAGPRGGHTVDFLIKIRSN